MPKRARPTLASTHRLLRNVFGLDEFPPGHEEIVESILSGRDTIGIVGSGGGNPLCYELPALLLPGTTIVVSWTSEMDERGDGAGAFVQMDGSQIVAAPKQVLVMTPEQLASTEFREGLQQADIALMVVDLTHVTSQPEHDVGSACLEIRDAIDALGRPPVFVLTAMPQGVDKLGAQIGLTNPHVVDARVYRPNLHLDVWRTSNEPQRRQHLVRLLQEIEGVGIVYAFNVRQVDLLYDLLSGFGLKVAKYHGRMSPKQRTENQARFVTDEIHAMIATNAFGTDLDKTNIRFVVHYNMPGTLEEYFQEAGRGGRDGRVTRCVLFHPVEERGTQPYFLGDRYPRVEDVQATYDALMRLRAGEGPVTITELKAAADNVPDAKVRVVLALLKDLGVVRERRGSKMDILRTNLSASALEELATQYKEHHATDRGKLEHMIEYGQGGGCRWKVLLEYFKQEVPWERCGTCDNCRQAMEQHVKPAAERTEAADWGQTLV